MPETSHVPDLPPPSAELILTRALVHAHIKTLSKKDRELFLREVADGLGVQEASLNVLRFRPRSEDKAVYAAMRQAQAWWRAVSVALRLE